MGDDRALALALCFLAVRAPAVACVVLGIDTSRAPDRSAVALVEGGRVRVLPTSCSETLLQMYRERA